MSQDNLIRSAFPFAVKSYRVVVGAVSDPAGHEDGEEGEESRGDDHLEVALAVPQERLRPVVVRVVHFAHRKVCLKRNVRKRAQFRGLHIIAEIGRRPAIIVRAVYECWGRQAAEDTSRETE